jgi:rare lipoprotein A
MRKTRDERRERENRPVARHVYRGAYSSIVYRLSSILVIAAIAVITGCGTTSKAPPQRGGGYYLDDGPGPNPPANLDSIPDAVPRVEPLHRGATRPYTVMGRSYRPMTSLAPYRARGIATWYGRRYHGKRTSSGEIYDMYAMTAAHTTLPIPSYARVTNPANGRSVVVRINDRGPFVGGRLIDLSYVAAHRLGVIAAGSAVVEVESIFPGATASPAIRPDPTPPPVAAERDPGPAVAIVSPEAAQAPRERAPNDTAGSPGIYLQFGAFGSKENAENQLGRLQAQAGWLSQGLHVHAQDGFYRVHAGPYASREEASRHAERLHQALGITALIVTR